MRNYKKLVREKVNSAIRKFGFEVVRFHPENDFICFTPELRAARVAAVANALFPVFKKHGYVDDLNVLRTIVEEFDEHYLRAPIRQTIGGSGYNGAVILFSFVRLMDPNMIVESGVFKGFTTWVLRLAAPQADIHSFDVDLSQLEYRDDSVNFYNHNWLEANLNGDDKSLIFFDDHINQARRIIEANSNGFSTIIFDDDFALSAPYIDTENIIPTVSMICDELIDSVEKIEWAVGQKKFKAHVDQHQVQQARACILSLDRLPTLANETGFNSSLLSLCRLH